MENTAYLYKPDPLDPYDEIEREARRIESEVNWMVRQPEEISDLLSELPEEKYHTFDLLVSNLASANEANLLPAAREMQAFIRDCAEQRI